MKRTHITYLKDLIGTIMKSPIPPSTDLVRLIPEDKIFEAHPREDKFQENAPFCVINHTPITPILDGRRWQKLSSVEISGVKNLRYLRRHFSQEFRYSLNFWFDDPTQSLLSIGDFSGRADDSGILDQSLIYIAKHKRFVTPQGVTVEVRPGRAALVSDPEEKKTLYKIFVEIVFKDGVFETELVPTLAGGTLEVESPIEVVVREL
ncbi:LIC10173 family protein [Leptospira weilii]|uniref:Uncharacterized protein n=1 Tax=Leptospira weilii str. UI 13098 TaxID=1088542 RepID=M6QFC0_9LEPT|nr:hypothetical protein [Leptospira weilii]EMN91203.1 hypothetical protein LEP1GSC108_3264 [Leptospira weilii str. UI 13098]